MDSDTLVSLITQHYSDRNFRRGPYKAQDALDEAKAADTTATEKLVVDESEVAWHAFYVAKKDAQSSHGFEGQAELAATLSTQSLEQRRSFAQQLAMKISSCISGGNSLEHRYSNYSSA
tara:strand:- start:3090 stop:3446 length:357 start_codon:yes stop_codon:yes gene_type:complete